MRRHWLIAARVTKPTCAIAAAEMLMTTADAVWSPPIPGTTSESGMGGFKVRRSVTRTRPVVASALLSMVFTDCLSFQGTFTICAH